MHIADILMGTAFITIGVLGALTMFIRIWADRRDKIE